MSRAKMPHRRYTDEFKMEAARLAQEVGVTEAARRLDMPMTSIQNWMKSGQQNTRTQTIGKKVTEEQAELNGAILSNARFRTLKLRASDVTEFVQQSTRLWSSLNGSRLDSVRSVRQD